MNQKNRHISLYLLILLIIFFPQKAISEVYTISGKTIDSLNIYYIHNILREIPELQVSAMDATDFDVSAANRSSLVTSGFVIAFDGIPTPPFHDGTIWSGMRRFMNRDIDSVIILTGPDRYSICGSCDAVVNIIPKKPPDKPFDFYAKSYVGSEVGDPTLYLSLLPKDRVPYNKEQIGAGEVAAGFRARNTSFGIGVSPVYTDRYSNRYESQRAGLYGSINSRQSMDEHRKFFLSAAYSRGSFSMALRPFLIDYNVFRFHQIHGRYYHYEGTTGGAHSSVSFTNEHTLVKLNMEGYIDKTSMSSGLNQSRSLEPSGFTLAGLIRRELNRSSLSFSIKASEHFSEKNRNTTRQDQDIHIDYINQPFNDLDIQAIYSLNNDVLEIGTAYPFRFYIRGEKETSGNSRIFYSAGTSKETTIKKLYWEHDASLGLKHEFELYSLNYSVDIGSRRGIDSLDLAHVKTGKRLFSPGANLSGRIKYIGSGLFRADPYKLHFRWQKSFFWNGLTLTGRINYRSRTYYNKSHLPLMFTQKGPSADTLPAFFTAGIMAGYSLFKEHMRLSISLRNIGKRHKELPQGTIIGPVVITNMTIAF